MGSSAEFAQNIVLRLSGAGDIKLRKMFGEYGIYCDGKFCAMVCDDVLYIKRTEAGRALLREVIEAPPYEGASLCFAISEPDDGEYLSQLIKATCAELPDKKPKKGKKNEV